LSQRPDHYKTMKAEVLVVHDCDKDKLKAMGLEFIRYTRPVGISPLQRKVLTH